MKAGQRHRKPDVSKPGQWRSLYKRLRRENAAVYGDIVDFIYTTREVGGQSFRFIVEKPNKGYAYSCTPADVCALLQAVPAEELQGMLDLFIFYQPKTKEEILDGCWGRLVYDYSYKDEISPAIIIEAVDVSRGQRIEKSSRPSDLEEIRLLQEEGHTFTDMGGYLVMKSTMEAVRRTQLYRTVFHEIGHYYDFIHEICRNHQDKEIFANKYARRMMDRLAEIKQF
jgi:hypothetical protein